MEKLSSANKRLKTALDDHDRECKAQIKKLDDKENLLTKRLEDLDKKKLETARANGNEDATDDDLVEVNGGGTVISAKRSTLTQLKGTRFEALFSGRWENKLQRDNGGRIFLDVNPTCFQAIVDYLNEMAISSEDNPPDPPSVDDEHTHILKHQLELFGLMAKVSKNKSLDSTIIQDERQVSQLHDWLKENQSDGDLNLIYRGSRDGLSNQAFHSKCDNQGCTLTIIRTSGGFVVGGYSNANWTSSNYCNQYSRCKKAFLFALPENDPTYIKSKYEMTSKNIEANSFQRKFKLKNANDSHAVYLYSQCGPAFGAGNDLYVNESIVGLNLGRSYQADPTGELNGSYPIKEMEVYKVTPSPQKQTTHVTFSSEANNQGKPSKVNQVNGFSKKVNNAINEKWVSLKEAEDELFYLEESFKDEGTFISFFASGQSQDVVALNVCGTTMVTRRSTLQLCKDSALASKFSGEIGNRSPGRDSIKEWNHEDVVAWLNRLEISESVIKDFEDNQVNGRELLALGVEGLKDFGVTKKGTIYLLLNEIKNLQKAGNDSAVLIEHSPYCFGKILDHLRLEGPFMKGLVKTKHRLPVVRSGEEGRYQKVVKHLFPGQSSKIFHESSGVEAEVEADMFHDHYHSYDY